MDGCMLGTVFLFAGNYVPKDFMECNGYSLDVRQHQALFSILGNTFGGTNNVTFNLPTLEAPRGFKYIICTNGLYPVRD